MAAGYNTDYIQRVRRNAELPSNAIPLSDNDVLELKFTALHKMNILDTWPVTWGVYGAATVASITGVAVLALYRLRFRLTAVRLAPAYPAVVVIPFATTGCFYHATIVQPVLTDQNLCSVCLQIRASLIGGFMGFVQPAMISAISAMLVAQKYKTVQMPGGLVGKLIMHRKIWKQNAIPLGLILLANVCLANFMPMKITTVNELVNHFITKRPSSDGDLMAD